MASRASLRHVVALTLGSLAATCMHCGPGNTDRPTQPIVLALMDAMKPHLGSVSAYSGMLYDRTGVRASWEVQPGMDWPAYAAWVTAASPGGFKAEAASDASALVLRRIDPADAYSVTLEPIPASEPLRVRATFIGRPF